MATLTIIYIEVLQVIFNNSVYYNSYCGEGKEHVYKVWPFVVLFLSSDMKSLKLYPQTVNKTPINIRWTIKDVVESIPLRVTETYL